MILQALTQYYEDLLHRGEIAAPGWSPAKISFALCLDKDGQVTQIIPTMEPVEIMFKISFCAVPDLSRVEPVSTSGPQFTSMASSAALPMALPILQAMAAV